MRIKKKLLQIRKPIPDTNSLLVALIICFSLINGTIGIANISYITIAVIYLLFFFGLRKRKCFLFKESLPILIVVTIAFLFSFFLVPDTTYTLSYFLYFLGFGIISFLIGMQKCNLEKVFAYSERIGFLCIAVFFFRGFGSYNASLQMGICYSILPVFLLSVVDVFEKKNLNLVAYANIVISLLFYVSIAPRGIWLSLGIFIVLYFYHIFTAAKDQKKAVIKQMLFFVGSLFLLLFVYMNMMHILDFIADIFYSLTGSRIYALEKLKFLISTGNIGNGRETLSETAIQLIQESIIFGHGIGYFETLENGLYVHNILLQALCEYGIFFMIPVGIMFIKGLSFILSRKESNDIDYKLNSFFIVIFLNGYIVLFYSSVYWKMLLFWFLLGYELHNLKKGRKGAHELYFSRTRLRRSKSLAQSEE